MDLYFFSGTGNARNVTAWIGKVAESMGTSTNIYDITKLPDRKHVKIKPQSFTGIVAPTHGFNFPPVMFHFILRLPRAKGNSAFIINTRAGMKMGKLFLPGLSGMAQYFTALILLFKGYRIIGMRGIDLPSNWISLHPGLKEKVVDSIYIHRKTEVEKFSRRLLSGRHDFRALFDLIQDLLITPVAFGYYLAGRFFLAKSFIASGDCNQCGLCIKECPVQAIRVVDHRPYWTFKCESCMHCMNRCPKRAIETAHGYVALLIVFVNTVILVQFGKFTGYDAFLNKVNSPLLAGSINITVFTIILIAVQLMTYRLLHYLVRYKPVEQLVSFSSLTKYKFWRRYKIRTPE